MLLSSVDLHLPTMIRVVPGSIKDVSTLKASIADLDLTLITLIMDRGLFSEENIRVMLESNLNFVVPTRRNSSLYDKVQKDLEGHFFYRQRLIKCVKTCYEERFLYLFEDVRLKEEEETMLYGFLDEKKIGEDEFRMGLLKAGRILMVSSLDVDCMRVFEMYKQREEVEGHFDIFKNTCTVIFYICRMRSLFLGICLFRFCRFMVIVFCRIFLEVGVCLIVFRLLICLKSSRRFM